LRSAIFPATTHPIAPAPMTANDAASPTFGESPLAAMLARIITGAHVHIA
jgi:hypothetical protein